MVRPLKKFKAGTAIYFRIEVRDEADDTRPLYSPSSNPKIQFRTPDGIITLVYTSMTLLETGVFSYTLQTTSASVLGVWQVEFKIVNASLTILTLPVDALELLP